MGTPTRLYNGVNTESQLTPTNRMGQLDPTRFHTYFNDWDVYAAGDWTITLVGTTPTVAVADGDGGTILQTNSAGVADSAYLQKVGSSFTMAAGKQTWFQARFKVSDATLSSVVFGLQITDTTPLAVSNGMYFLKAAAAATFDFKSVTGSTVTTAAAIGSLVDATFIDLAFYYDGGTEVQYFINDVLIGRMTVATLPAGALTVSFGMANGEAVAKTMTTDYIFAAQER